MSAEESDSSSGLEEQRERRAKGMLAASLGDIRLGQKYSYIKLAKQHSHS